MTTGSVHAINFPTIGLLAPPARLHSRRAVPFPPLPTPAKAPQDNPLRMTEAFAVVSHGSQFGVSLGNGTFAPITRTGTPRHRADVAVTEISDLACMGLPGGDYDIRPAALEHWTSVEPIGTCAPVMRGRIMAAIVREVEARRLESKYRVSAGFASIAGESSRMAPGTRRVGAHQS